MEITIFYSWQSNTNLKYNKDFIKECIELAMEEIKELSDPELKDIQIQLIEGTRDKPGTSGISDTIILEHCRTSSIFIGDLSITNKLLPEMKEMFEKAKAEIPLPIFNQNVLSEYATFSAQKGRDQVIGVMNTSYGPPEKLLFDFRHLEVQTYCYDESFESERETIKTGLVKVLRHKIILCIKSVIGKIESRYSPFINWSQQSKKRSFHNEFITNDRIDDIKTQLINNRGNIRLLGLSGLGKSRIVFEAFRNNGDNLSLKYLYCEYQDRINEYQIQQIVNAIFSTNEDLVLIIDNCSLEFHRRLLEEKDNHNSAIPIITINNNPEEIEESKEDNTEYIIIKIDELVSVVDNILERLFSMLGEEIISTIKDFSAGIPQMAVLLAESVNAGEEYIGHLNDKKLLSKLLSIEENSDERVMLQSCSLFKQIGYGDELREELIFVIGNKNITPITGDDINVKISKFNKLFLRLKSREIFESKGRFFGLRPRPLAFSLSMEWILNCEQDRLLRVVEDLLNSENKRRNSLIDSFCNQLKYLAYNEKVKQIVARLTDERGPFDSAEVVKTELGSRFFRAFVEVNPVAVANNLYRIFGSMASEQLYEIKDRGRRNLVLVLEKLCFDRNTFDKGAKLLMSFSVAENETWGNNSTGQFLQLFKVHLAGTEATLDERLKIISWGLDKDEEYKDLSFRAISAALEAQHFVRFSGGETRGTSRLKDYVPSSIEIKKYWRDVLDILKKYILDESDYSDISSDILSKKIRGLFLAGAAKNIMPILIDVLEKKNYDWDKMLDALLDIQNYDAEGADNELIVEIDSFIKKLTKDDFISKYSSVSKIAKTIKWKRFEEVTLLQAEEYQKLAEEFINDEFGSDSSWMFIYAKNLIYPIGFGNKCAELIYGKKEKINEFIDKSIEALSKNGMENRDFSVLIDFARGISKDKDAKEHLINALSKNNSLAYLLFPITAAIGTDINKLDLLFELVNKDKVSITEFSLFFNYYSYNIENSEADIVRLCERILQYEQKGTGTAFRIIYSILYFNRMSTPSKLYDVLEKCIKKTNIIDFGDISKDDYIGAATLLLKETDRPEFAKYINGEVIRLSKESARSAMNFNYDLDRMYEILLGKYFDSIWEDLSNALLLDDTDYLAFYYLKSLLESSFSNTSPNNGVGLLFAGNEEHFDQIFQWCRDNPSKAPARLAMMIPISEGSSFHPIFTKLLNEFGSDKGVLDNLKCKMESFSWQGSVIPLYQSRIDLFKTLLDHSNNDVKDWAEKSILSLEYEIKREEQRESEHNFLYL